VTDGESAGLPMARDGAQSGSEQVLDLYRRMLRIRRAEECLAKLFADGEIPGFIHLSVGQEAVAVGVGATLDLADTLASNHRGHGHALAKGMKLKPFFLELMGKGDGICGGRGGSMHVADMSVGMLGANGIVGAGMSLALGSALALQTRGTRNIACVFFGDGAVAEGILHECLNLAALWKLPLLFICENNGWAEFSPTSRQIAVRLEALAGAFGVRYHDVDGNDVEAVHATASDIVSSMRGEPQPYVLECRTRRVRGHYEGDPQKYRVGEDTSDVPEDPLIRAEERLETLGVPESDLKRLDREVQAEIDDAVTAARDGAQPEFARALADVYAARGGA
jgi:acetoin:2,6-dichlorophenolindophenol oxidoreductase subunit alpha